jgi:hypothetical protein
MLHFYSTAGMASLRRLHGHACMMASARARARAAAPPFARARRSAAFHA